MTKKHFIALADAIRTVNSNSSTTNQFSAKSIEAIADFCQAQNCQFNRSLWLSYIAGECGPSGKKIKSVA